MTTKEELNEMRELDRYVAGLAIVIADMRNTLTAMDYSEVRVQATNAYADLSALIAKIEAYNRELEDEVDKLLEKRKTLKAEVTAVLSGIQLQIIILRYFSMNYTWENIADMLGCSHQNVIQIHGRAIKKLTKHKKIQKRLQKVAESC